MDVEQGQDPKESHMCTAEEIMPEMSQERAAEKDQQASQDGGSEREGEE